MKRLIFFIPLILFGCSTLKPVSTDNSYEASKSAAKIETIVDNLSTQSNVSKSFNLKSSEILKKTDNLIDELEASIEYEKVQEYNKGVEEGYNAGYKQALIDLEVKYNEK